MCAANHRCSVARTGLSQGTFGFEQIELTELAFAVADARDPGRFLRCRKRWPSRVARGRGGVRGLDSRRGDGLFCVKHCKPPVRVGLLALRQGEITITPREQGEQP